MYYVSISDLQLTTGNQESSAVQRRSPNRLNAVTVYWKSLRLNWRAEGLRNVIRRTLVFFAYVAYYGGAPPSLLEAQSIFV